jgi:hypothetical protein
MLPEREANLTFQLGGFINELPVEVGDRVQAGDGLAAMALLDGRKINMAVCDVNMPRMNGIEFVRTLRGDARFTAVVTPHDAERMVVAALLHDLGHWPFCHAIEDLDLVTPLEIHPAVAATLSVPLDLGRGRPLQMQLDVAEFLPGHQAAAIHLHRPAHQRPLGFAAVLRLPSRQILPVEQHDRVRGCSGTIGEGGCRRHDGGWGVLGVRRQGEYGETGNGNNGGRSKQVHAVPLDGSNAARIQP